MKVVRRMLVALLAAPALLLTSCGDDTEPGGASFPTATLSPTPSATAPPKRETAEHFIRRYYAAEREMENSGQTRAYRALTHNCTACEGLMRQVRRIYTSGGFIRWDGLRVLSVKANGREGDGSVTFKVKTDSAPTHYRESASSPTKHLAGGSSTILIALDHHGSSWLANGILKLS